MPRYNAVAVLPDDRHEIMLRDRHTGDRLRLDNLGLAESPNAVHVAESVGDFAGTGHGRFLYLARFFRRLTFTRSRRAAFRIFALFRCRFRSFVLLFLFRPALIANARLCSPIHPQQIRVNQISLVEIRLV